MRTFMDKLFTGAVLICLVSSAYVSYYLRPWRWLRPKQKSAVPDNPYAQIPIVPRPETGEPEKTEKAAA